jgi:type 1 glutamine amidotransferase
MSTIKALALGSYSNVKYHPFKDVDREFENIFKGEVEVHCTEDLDSLNPETLAGYELIISYTEFSDQPLSPQQTAALISFVAGGGGLLVVHNGISLQRTQELGTVLGGYFTHHPEYTSLHIEFPQPDHPIVQGMEAFAIDDEPYYFEMQPHFKTTVLAQYLHEGALREAAWCHGFGQGRVVYLMPGHHLPSFSVKPFRQLILRSGLWAAARL